MPSATCALRQPPARRLEMAADCRLTLEGGLPKVAGVRELILRESRSHDGSPDCEQTPPSGGGWD